MLCVKYFFLMIVSSICIKHISSFLALSGIFMCWKWKTKTFCGSDSPLKNNNWLLPSAHPKIPIQTYRRHDDDFVSMMLCPTLCLAFETTFSWKPLTNYVSSAVCDRFYLTVWNRSMRLRHDRYCVQWSSLHLAISILLLVPHASTETPLVSSPRLQ